MATIASSLMDDLAAIPKATSASVRIPTFFPHCRTKSGTLRIPGIRSGMVSSALVTLLVKVYACLVDLICDSDTYHSHVQRSPVSSKIPSAHCYQFPSGIKLNRSWTWQMQDDSDGFCIVFVVVVVEITDLEEWYWVSNILLLLTQFHSRIYNLIQQPVG